MNTTQVKKGPIASTGVRINNNPLTIKWNDFDAKNVKIYPPKNKGKTFKYDSCVIKYNYTQPDGTKREGPVKITLPENNASGGITENKDDDTGKVQGYALGFSIDSKSVEGKAILGILHEIYMCVLRYRVKKYKEFKNISGDYNNIEVPNLENTKKDFRAFPWQGCKHMIKFTHTAGVVDETAPATLWCKVFKEGFAKTRFVVDDGASTNELSWQFCRKPGFRGVPCIRINDYFINALHKKIRISLESFLVTDVFPKQNSIDLGDVIIDNRTKRNEDADDIMDIIMKLDEQEPDLPSDDVEGSDSDSDSSSDKKKGKKGKKDVKKTARESTKESSKPSKEKPKEKKGKKEPPKKETKKETKKEVKKSSSESESESASSESGSE